MRRAFDPVHLGSPRFQHASHGPFLVTDVWFPPRLELPAHWHDRTVLAVTLGGRWDSVMLGRSHSSGPGQVLTEPAAERHSNRFSEGTSVVAIQIDPGQRAALNVCSPLLSDIHHFRSEAIGGLARRLQSELRGGDVLAGMAIEGLCLEIVVAADRRRRAAARRQGSPPWLDRVTDYLRACALDPIGLDDVAAVAGVHRGTVAREFRRRHGMSVASYLRMRRIEWAAVRLTESDDSIAQIAAASGFFDQSHFTRLFHRIAGDTPGRFRAAARIARRRR